MADEKVGMPHPDHREPKAKEVDELAMKIRSAIDQFIWRTGLKPDWVSFDYGKVTTTVSIVLQQYDYSDIPGPVFNDEEEIPVPGPGGEMPPEVEPI